MPRRGIPRSKRSRANDDDEEEAKRSLKQILSLITWNQIKWLFQMAKSELLLIIIGSICVGVSGVISLVVPNFVGRFVDTTISDEGGLQYLLTLSLILLGVIALASCFALVRELTLSMAGLRLTRRIRNILFTNLTNQDIGFFDATKSGELLNRISTDTEKLEEAVTRSFALFVRNIFTFCAGMGILFYTSWKLCLVIFGALIPFVVISGVVSGCLSKYFSKRRQDALANMGDVATEVLTNMRTVRTFARETYHAKEYKKALDKAFYIDIKFLLVNSFSKTGMELVGGVALVGVLFFGGYLVMQHELTIGSLTSFLMYILIVTGAMNTISQIYVDVIAAIAATERVHQLTTREPALPCKDEGMIPDQSKSTVKLDSVDFAYPTRSTTSILNNFTLELAPDSVVALVGESGGGKSTITKLIQGFYPIQKGFIQYGDINYDDINPIWLRSHIGVVPQEPVLFSCSIRDNIRYGRLDATHEEIEQAARDANAASFIDQFENGYDTLCGEKGVSLSGGQKQRIAIARALLKDPPLLILDEATSALDAESEYVVKKALDRLMAGRTTLIVAHRLSSIRHADKICVIQNGSIVESGTHESLISLKGAYANLIEKQLFMEDDTPPQDGTSPQKSSPPKPLQKSSIVHVDSYDSGNYDDSGESQRLLP